MIRRAAAGAGKHSVHARPFSIYWCNKSAKGAIGDEKDVGDGGIRCRGSLLAGFGDSLQWGRWMRPLRSLGPGRLFSTLKTCQKSQAYAA